MKKMRKFLLPVLFMSAIIIMSAVIFFAPKKTYSENEKRVLASFPKISVESVLSGKLQDETEAYISDHIPGRDFFVGINSYYSYLLGRNSLGDIYKAEDGYLINAPKEDKAGNFIKNMNNIEAFTKKSGIPSTLMIIPSAGYIMEDKLPLFSKSYDDASLFRTASELTPDISFFDVRQTLCDAYKNNTQIYYRTDHHLTSEGSYAIYNAYCDFKGLNCPLKEQYTIEKHGGFYGTTYSSSGYWLTDADNIEIWDLGLNAEVTLEEKDSKTSDTMFFRGHLENKDMYPVFLDGNHGYVRIENPHAPEGNLLIIRDSFAQNAAPFLSYNYKNIHMLDMRYYRNSMKSFLDAYEIDEILYLFGIDTLKTDFSTSWLLF